MISRNITIKNSVGLYARPATFFIQKANTYKSSIWMQKDDRRVNAKSLLGVLSLAISGGSTVTLIADGPDEAEAISGLELLVSTEI
ncbi:MAG: HPr family phosphocarrier protein [Clostridia bacterium]|nr:HPr family phosphocarrier protein [Clostridia bacterium]MBP3555945.1 HPr family phosphocarrier protein [Clostridia bacterium]MBQ8418873.1 HPr family phosphocarrier protein [Clostridia bacterium]